jgi:hypothetical protein
MSGESFLLTGSSVNYRNSWQLANDQEVDAGHF